MSNDFWKWYKEQKPILSKEELCDGDFRELKQYIIGYMIKFIFDKKGKIDIKKDFNTFDEFYAWVRLGVSWNSGD